MNLKTLAEATCAQAQLYNDKTAFIIHNQQLSYNQLNLHSNQVSKALIKENIEPSSRVPFLGKDSFVGYEILFGSVKAKAVFMPINWRLTKEEISYIISDSEAKIIFVDQEFSQILEEINTKLINKLKIIVINNRETDYIDYFEWRSEQLPVMPDFEYNSNDVVVQIYTSGTTGRPKGVQLCNYSFFSLMSIMSNQGDRWMNLNPEDTLLLSLPIFHIGGMWWAVQCFLSGGIGVVLEMFQGWKALEEIETHKITKVAMVPAMIQFCLLEPSINTMDFSSVKGFLYGGSPISPSLLKKVKELFKCDFFQIYGMTETGNMAVCLNSKDHSKESDQLLKSAGKPLSGVEIKVMNTEGKPVEDNSIGEIWIKSPSNMIGYWKNEDANNKTLVDGWVRTGDAGYLDNEGYLFICDRIKDMIIYAGENIYPVEIENIISKHELITEVAVIGIPDEKWGEIVKAIVVPEKEKLINKGIMISFLKGKIADYKIPKSFSFVESLPRNPSGKILKTELRKPFWSEKERLIN